MSKNLMICAAACGALTVACASQAQCVCPADVNLSGFVDGVDLGVLLANWGPCGLCVADLDLNGDVNGIDLGIMLSQWGPCEFQYGPPARNPEAMQIALEMLGPGGPLLPTQAAYDRIAADLAAIRAAVPALAGQGHTMEWANMQIIVAVINGTPTPQYDALNACFGLVKEDQMFVSGGATWYLLTFPGAINVEALSVMYQSTPEVSIAEPNGLIGGQNFWTPTPLPGTPDELWQWEVDDGFNDCFDGCDCHILYTIRTNSLGQVQVLDVQMFGASWCEFPR